MIQAWSLIAALDYKYYILCTTNDTGMVAYSGFRL